MSDGIWGVIILPAPDDVADECSHCDIHDSYQRRQRRKYGKKED